MSTNPTPQFNTAQYPPPPPQGPAPDAQGAYPRALLLGIVGAAIGLALYAGFAILTNIMISWVSLAVGFIVAKAMMIGSKGIGGRQYQITAVVLTYCAVSFSVIPIVLYQTGIPFSALPLAKVIQIGLTSPFLGLQTDTFRGLIGLVILFVGINIAWKMTGEKVHPA